MTTARVTGRARSRARGRGRAGRGGRARAPRRARGRALLVRPTGAPPCAGRGRGRRVLKNGEPPARREASRTTSRSASGPSPSRATRSDSRAAADPDGRPALLDDATGVRSPASEALHATRAAARGTPRRPRRGGGVPETMRTASSASSRDLDDVAQRGIVGREIRACGPTGLDPAFRTAPSGILSSMALSDTRLAAQAAFVARRLLADGAREDGRAGGRSGGPSRRSSSFDRDRERALDDEVKKLLREERGGDPRRGRRLRRDVPEGEEDARREEEDPAVRGDVDDPDDRGAAREPRVAAGSLAGGRRRRAPRRSSTGRGSSRRASGSSSSGDPGSFDEIDPFVVHRCRDFGMDDAANADPGRRRRRGVGPRRRPARLRLRAGLHGLRRLALRDERREDLQDHGPRDEGRRAGRRAERLGRRADPGRRRLARRLRRHLPAQHARLGRRPADLARSSAPARAAPSTRPRSRTSS